MIQTLVILGASGDLTSRFLMPAIARLHQEGRLPEGFRVLGVAWDDWNTERFRNHLEQKLASPGTAGVAGPLEAILGRVDYRRVDVTSRDQLARALGDLTDPLVAYLALPPALFAPSIESLVALKLPKGSKVVLEKPFGESLESAQALNRLLHESFNERAFTEAGFQDFQVHLPEVSPHPQGMEDGAFWTDYLTHPPAVLIECVKK